MEGFSRKILVKKTLSNQYLIDIIKSNNMEKG